MEKNVCRTLAEECMAELSPARKSNQQHQLFLRVEMRSTNERMISVTNRSFVFQPKQGLLRSRCVATARYLQPTVCYYFNGHVRFYSFLL